MIASADASFTEDPDSVDLLFLAVVDLDSVERGASSTVCASFTSLKTASVVSSCTDWAARFEVDLGTAVFFAVLAVFAADVFVLVFADLFDDFADADFVDVDFAEVEFAAVDLVGAAFFARVLVVVLADERAGDALVAVDFDRVDVPVDFADALEVDFVVVFLVLDAVLRVVAAFRGRGLFRLC